MAIIKRTRDPFTRRTSKKQLPFVRLSAINTVYLST